MSDALKIKADKDEEVFESSQGNNGRKDEVVGKEWEVVRKRQNKSSCYKVRSFCGYESSLQHLYQ